MPAPGSTELALDRLLAAERFPVLEAAPIRIGMEVLVKAMVDVGLLAPEPGMVLTVVGTRAHPDLEKVMDAALETAGLVGARVEPWQLAAILSASLTRLDAIQGRLRSYEPSVTPPCSPFRPSHGGGPFEPGSR